MQKKQPIKLKWRLITGIFLLTLIVGSGSAFAASEKPIVFGDASWDSIQVHNRIAAFIIENGLGYKTDFMVGETIPIVTGVIRGDIDVDMESWTENIQEVYDKGIKSGKMLDLGPNYPDSWQGWLVPTYVIKGDPERGIKALAPDLKSVSDLSRYWKIFKDPEVPEKGRFYNSIPGWAITKFNDQKMKAYGLDKYYNSFLPGSDAALSGSMAAAYKRGKPWFGYYWAPTWVLGKYDMTPLEEPPYNKEVWEKTAGCAVPSVQVNILVNSKLPERAPDVVEFLKKYETTTAMCNKFLAYMKNNKAKTQDAAIWFLKNYEPVWTQWVSADVAAKVKAALK
ncbi:MAG: ABC transporter substrate-binding protein [Desulfobacterales bacterium]|nr:ABC transporter substrate-binding protein [Desulfobacterales bacterium]MDD4072025.1 ABC transporter substrate-binding protein [Desulfobacterales bacterium]MDD4392602.1 ABC transporter substrate-binding protein [Desulfobacterales bacterium]